MKSPQISVCIPLYNGERHLEWCLKSVASQTFEDFEAVIVDDGSTDGGLEIAKRWAIADPRFRVVVNERNLGLVGNWNRCVQIASGEWIKFLFQDDLMEPECLAEMLDAGKSGCGFVACSRSLLYEGEIEPGLKKWYEKHSQLLERIYGSGLHMPPDEYSRAKLQSLEFNIVGEPSVTLIARRLFDEYGLFDPLMVQLCDGEMWNRICSNVGLDYVSRRLVAFRIHAHSATQANLNRQFRGWILEEIVELNRLCRLPALTRFRSVARKEGRWASLQSRLSVRMNNALDEARWASQECPPNRRLQEELSAVFEQLPGARRAKLRHFAHRLGRRLGARRFGAGESD